MRFLAAVLSHYCWIRDINNASCEGTHSNTNVHTHTQTLAYTNKIPTELSFSEFYAVKCENLSNPSNHTITPDNTLYIPSSNALLAHQTLQYFHIYGDIVQPTYGNMRRRVPAHTSL